MINEMFGCPFVGMVSDPHVNGGKPLSVYELSEETVDSWNRKRFTLCEHTLKAKLHRTPTKQEVYAEMDRNAAEARRLIAESGRSA